MIKHISKLFEQGIQPEEVVKWIKVFSQIQQPHRFAVVKLSGESIDDFADDIAYSLGTLARLELFPIVVYGWGTRLDDVLAKAQVKSEKHPETGPARGAHHESGRPHSPGGAG